MTPPPRNCTLSLAVSHKSVPQKCLKRGSSAPQECLRKVSEECLAIRFPQTWLILSSTTSPYHSHFSTTYIINRTGFVRPMVGRIMLDGPEMWCQNAFLMLIQPDFFCCNILQRILPTKMNQYIYIYIYINQKKFVYPKQLCNIMI